MARKPDRRIFSGTLWPAHLKPKPDELLSSWLMRLSMAHGQKLHTFCSLAWPGKAIWNRDVDKSASAEIVHTLSNKTATPVLRAQATTLSAYEGVLYEKHNRFGPNPWIMPVGIYHRTRVQFGLQYCPLCLAEDEEPYFRRKWRLAFMVICENHHKLLHDRCPQCGGAVNFHRDELGDFRKYAPTSMINCYVCGFDLRTLRDNSSRYSPATRAEVEFAVRLLQIINTGVARVSQAVTAYSHLYFTVLRQLMKIIGMRNTKIERLRQAIGDTYGVETYVPAKKQQPDIQEQSIPERRQLPGLTRCLLEEWPDRFIALAQEHGIWSSTWLRHLESGSRQQSQAAPFWFWEVVYEHLNRTRYCPSDEEMGEAIRYLRRSGAVLNKSTLSRGLAGGPPGRGGEMLVRFSPGTSALVPADSAAVIAILTSGLVTSTLATLSSFAKTSKAKALA
jgi:hypothetical protein